MIAEAARSAASTIRLLYVPPIRPHGDGALTARHRGEKRRLQAEGLHYLDTIAESLGDVPVERVIRFGDVNMAILDEAAAWAADVVALSAGDRMWLSRAVRTGTAVGAFGRNGIPAILYTPRRRPKASAVETGGVKSAANLQIAPCPRNVLKEVRAMARQAAEAGDEHALGRA